MNILSKWLQQRRKRKDFLRMLELRHVTWQSAWDVYHDMFATLGITKMRELLEKAEKQEDKYVSLTTWYFEELLKNRGQSKQ